MSNAMLVHPAAPEMSTFAKELQAHANSLPQTIAHLMDWFDQNIAYSRLDAPYFPLQRSDLDVLALRSGTCGDYSCLAVSLLLSLGIPAQYAWVTKDCFGDEQDHICAAALYSGQWVLIDATNPYRKWMGFNCKHIEYELLSPAAFEAKIMAEEQRCLEKALSLGNRDLAGLFFAPWVYDETVLDAEDRLESVFFLLILTSELRYTVYINYFAYTAKNGCSPMMATADENGTSYQFSVHAPKGIWDDEQWGESYAWDQIPASFRTETLERLHACMERNLPRIVKMVP